MVDNVLVSELSRAGINYKLNEPMSRHTSFRIGGSVPIMLFPQNAEEMTVLCGMLKKCGEKPLIIGRGTNLLVTDEPLERIVIQTGSMCSVSGAGERLNAECGISLLKLAVYAKEHELSGLEFAHGIPGSLGGAVYMNAGAYGGEMSHVVEAVEYLDEALNICRAEGKANDFGYRKSAFEGTERIILRAELKLSLSEADKIGEKMDELADKRRASQPLDKASAGSTFKRPASGYAAAMIQEAGLKGFAIGGAQVSEKHSGFVVNNGSASFDDVIKVMEHVRSEVYKKFGTELEPEIKIVRN